MAKLLLAVASLRQIDFFAPKLQYPKPTIVIRSMTGMQSIRYTYADLICFRWSTLMNHTARVKFQTIVMLQEVFIKMDLTLNEPTSNSALPDIAPSQLCNRSEKVSAALELIRRTIGETLDDESAEEALYDEYSPASSE